LTEIAVILKTSDLLGIVDPEWAWIDKKNTRLMSKYLFPLLPCSKSCHAANLAMQQILPGSKSCQGANPIRTGWQKIRNGTFFGKST